MGQSKKKQTVRTMIIPAQFESLDKVREFVAWAAGVCGLNEKGIYSVQLAVDEACSNIIEHAYGGEGEEEIECTCHLDESGLTVTIRDCGHPFNPLQVRDPDLNARLEDRDAGGLGLYFIRKLMDEVHFKFVSSGPDKDGCNVLTMVKRKEHGA
jgi:serine/threonine-protein kinase RsbW